MDMETQPSPENLNDVRLAIFRQHTRLAQLLDELEAHANAVIAGGEEGAALRKALDVLHSRFVRHLEYEETHLPRWLPPAAEGAGALLGDHSDQRSRLKGLVHDRDVFGDGRGLALEARAFVHLLRKDLAEEDAKLRALR